MVLGHYEPPKSGRWFTRLVSDERRFWSPGVWAGRAADMRPGGRPGVPERGASVVPGSPPKRTALSTLAPLGSRVCPHGKYGVSTLIRTGDPARCALDIARNVREAA